jgi:hypothetical protein
VEPDDVGFYVDGRLIKVVRQSPAYPMQFMLTIYEFADDPRLPFAPDRYPKTFVVERFRGYDPSPAQVRDLARSPQPDQNILQV